VFPNDAVCLRRAACARAFGWYGFRFLSREPFASRGFSFGKTKPFAPAGNLAHSSDHLLITLLEFFQQPWAP
jgi:hypothetical protein